jgi:hypothetical protein
MTSRLAVILITALVGGGFALAEMGCAHPYSGKPERLRKPRKKKRKKKEKKEGEEEVKWDEKCRTNFFDKPTKRRRPRSARAQAKAANQILLSAEDKEGRDRVMLVTDAVNKLKSSLKKDPYGPLATYKLAVAYALVAKKGCALELLKRLQVLTTHPDVEAEARRTVKRAANEPAFDGFRKDANAALGE